MIPECPLVADEKWLMSATDVGWSVACVVSINLRHQCFDEVIVVDVSETAIQSSLHSSFCVGNLNYIVH